MTPRAEPPECGDKLRHDEQPRSQPEGLAGNHQHYEPPEPHQAEQWCDRQSSEVADSPWSVEPDGCSCRALHFDFAEGENTLISAVPQAAHRPLEGARSPNDKLARFAVRSLDQQPSTLTVSICRERLR